MTTKKYKSKMSLEQDNTFNWPGFDEENDQHYYWIYYFKNGKVEIIGKSSVKPQCYKQAARYLK